jgi:hypothetical protein
MLKGQKRILPFSFFRATPLLAFNSLSYGKTPSHNMNLGQSVSGSFSDFLHIISVGFVFSLIVGGWTFNRKIVHEKDIHLQLYVSRWAGSIALLWPLVALLLLVTGTGNIYTQYLVRNIHWYSEGWLVAKLIFFVILVVNGSVLGGMLGRKRTSLLQSSSEQQAPENTDLLLKNINRQFALHYLVQFLLIAIIVFLSMFGSG